MHESFSTQQLLVLRKLTRATADLLRGQMKEYLSALAPLFRPRTVLGDYIQSSTKEAAKGADKAFKDFQALYETIAGAKPFNLPKELKPPLEIAGPSLEITPMEYAYTAKTERENKAVTVTSPLKWVLSYPGFPPGRLKELLAARDRSSDELQRFAFHYLALHLVVSRQAGLAQILEALHFPIGSERLPEAGELPITCISSSVSTTRPPDEVIIESTEISGMAAFEEVVNLEDIVKLRDPLKDRLVELVRSHGEDLLPRPS